MTDERHDFDRPMFDHKLERDTVRENLDRKYPEREFPTWLRHIRLLLVKALDALDRKDDGVHIPLPKGEGIKVSLRVRFTERQRDGMRKVLRKLASATSARWDQHLRDEISDWDADVVIAWLRAELNALPEGQQHHDDCEANRAGVGGDGLCSMGCAEKDGEE